MDEGLVEAPDAGAAEVVVDDTLLDVAEPEAQPEVAPEEPSMRSHQLEVEDPEFQNAILESCSVRPLTPLGRCVGLASITTTCKTAGGVFEGQDFPYQTYSYREPLLAHVQVYSFAKYHLLRGLQNLALQRMISTLRKMDCSVTDAERELTETIEFVYESVPADGENEEPMRKPLSHFAAVNYTSLMHGSFEALFAASGDFTLDLARKLSRRLSAHRVSAGLAEDNLECRILDLELQLQEREETIR